MTINRNSARWIGVLFLFATASYLTGSGLIDSILSQPDFLSKLQSNQTTIMAGMFLEIANCAAVVGIAAWMVPIIKPHHEAIALGYFGSRIVEGVLLAMGILFTFMLLALGGDYSGSGSTETGYFHRMANLMMSGQQMAFQLAMLSLGIGSVLLCYSFYRTRMIPRLFSLLGIVGYLALIASSCLTLLEYEPGWVLFVPGAIFELLFPVWLLIKGFRTQHE